MIEGYYTPQKFTLIAGRLENGNGTQIQFSSSKATFNAWGLCIKPGFQAYFGKNFLAEGFFGIGWKWRNITHQLTNASVVASIEKDFSFTTMEDKQGKSSTIFIDLGLKIGFSFGGVKY